MIDVGGVFVDRTRVKVAGRIVRAGQTIEVNWGGAVERVRTAEPTLTPRIVHADDHIVVVDKPAGLVTAPTPESDRGDLLDQLATSHGEIYLVHRLDLPTSGLLVFARTRDANKRLGELFKVHDVEREYRAIAIGAVAAQTIDRPIDARRAVTHVEPLETLPDDLKRVRPTVFFAVPRVWEKLKARAEGRIAGLEGAQRRLFEWALAVTRRYVERVLSGQAMPVALAAQYALARRSVTGPLKARIGFDRCRLFVTSAAPIGREVLEFFASVDVVLRGRDPAAVLGGDPGRPWSVDVDPESLL